MKNKNIIWIVSLFALVATTMSTVSCNKKFDEPPIVDSVSDPAKTVKVNCTIKNLKKIAPASGRFKEITNDTIISGIVVANDKSGNIYKQMFIQDSTGGIMLEIDATGLYTTFPVGREIFIKCKGLFLANENGMIKICTRTLTNGVYSIFGIPSALIDTYIIKGLTGKPVVPKVVTLGELNDDYQSMLVQLDNYEVSDGDKYKTFSDISANKATININVQNCSGDKSIIRNSGYANFAGNSLPRGNGSLIAIYTVYNTTKQFLIRDTSDLKFYNLRCDGSDPNTPLSIMTVKAVRDLAVGTLLPSNTALEGIVVSNTANEASGNYRLQDASGRGIQFRTASASVNGNWELNSKLRIIVSGLSTSIFGTDLQINGISGAILVGTGSVVPKITTIADLFTNQDVLNSTVVTIKDVEIIQGSTATTGINYTIKDATGTITTFIRTTLKYAPPTKAKSITGYVSKFNNTPQLTLRQAEDVVE